MKCFCDTVILDDFKTALDRLRLSALNRSRQQPSTGRGMLMSPGQSTVGTFPTKTTTVDIEKGDSDIELEMSRRSDPTAIYISQTVTVEGR